MLYHRQLCSASMKGLESRAEGTDLPAETMLIHVSASVKLTRSRSLTLAIVCNRIIYLDGILVRPTPRAQFRKPTLVRITTLSLGHCYLDQPHPKGSHTLMSLRAFPSTISDWPAEYLCHMSVVTL